MNEIINIFENSMSLTVTTVIAAIGVGLNVWFKKKATGDKKREELIKSNHCLNKSASEIDEIIKNYYKNLIENERDKLVLLDGRTINLFEDIFNEKHTNNTNTEHTVNTEADSEKRWEQSMRSYKKYKLESNIKKEYKRLKKRMKYPMHYARYIIANIGFFVMIICTTGLLNASESDISGHSYVVGALLIASIISIIITICNISYIGEY